LKSPRSRSTKSGRRNATLTENEIAAAIAKVVTEGRYDGMSGNCARFAIAFNHAQGISENPGPTA
jgi:hypothetical protein